VRFGARSKNQFKRVADIFGPSGALWDAGTPWWRSPRAVSVAAAIFGVAFTCLAWFAASERENRLALQQFEASAGDHLLVLQNGVDQYINDISAFRAAFQASEHGISRREFQSLSDLLFHEKNAIYATSWLPRVTRDERSAHELEGAREGLQGYSIKSVAPDGSLAPTMEASEYFPVFYSSKEPSDSFPYGLDNNDGGTRRRTLERARDTDRAAASQNIVLRRGEGNRNGFLVALPVYKPGLPHDTVEERRRNLSGFIQGVFQTGVMIESILASTITPTGLDLYFFAADAGADAAPLYFHPSRLRGGLAVPLSHAAIVQELHWSGKLRVADRGWTFITAPIPDQIGTANHLGSWGILLGGLAISGIVTAYLWSARRNAERLELGNKALRHVNDALDAANERLLAQNARFDTALNNMSQGLGFFDGAQRLIVCNRRLFEMYGLPLDRMVPGITLAEITDLRWEAGSVPAMGKEDYLEWRNSLAISDGPTDTTVQLVNGCIVRIRRQPTPDGGWVATHEDITEQRKAEMALAEARVKAERAQQDAQAAHARLVEAFEVVPEGIAMMDADDRLVRSRRGCGSRICFARALRPASMRTPKAGKKSGWPRGLPVTRCRRTGMNSSCRRVATSSSRSAEPRTAEASASASTSPR
jgi:CHASE1-domain containing sensor protein